MLLNLINAVTINISKKVPKTKFIPILSHPFLSPSSLYLRFTLFPQLSIFYSLSLSFSLSLAVSHTLFLSTFSPFFSLIYLTLFFLLTLNIWGISFYFFHFSMKLRFFDMFSIIIFFSLFVPLLCSFYVFFLLGLESQLFFYLS